MADQGADVIKLEGPSGPDLTRGLGAQPEMATKGMDQAGLSAMYVTANRGKRSTTVDLQQLAGVEVLKRMVAHSDVVVQFSEGNDEDLDEDGEPDELMGDKRGTLTEDQIDALFSKIRAHAVSK